MKPKILFVDDQQNILDGYRRHLFKDRNEWDVFYAVNGEEALKILEKENINVIVSDMKMPQMDGPALLTLVKEKYSNIIRIMLTGNTDNEDKIKSINLVHKMLFKPCYIDELKEIIRNLLRSDNYPYDDYALNP